MAAGENSQQLAATTSLAILLAVGEVTSIDALGSRTSPVRLSSVLCLAALAASAALLLSGSRRLAQLALVLAATQAGALTANYLMGTAGIARGVAPVFVVLFGGLLFCGNVYSELSDVDAVILFLAPNAAWIALRVTRFDGLGRMAIDAGLVLAASSPALAHLWALFAGRLSE